MLTGAAKLYFLLAFNGMLLLIQPTVRAFIGKRDGVDVGLILVGTLLLAAGYGQLRRNPMAGSFGRRLFVELPLRSGKDRVAFFLILIGATQLPDPLRNIWEGESFASEWPYLALYVALLGIGWLLAFSELWQSRSPEK